MTTIGNLAIDLYLEGWEIIGALLQGDYRGAALLPLGQFECQTRSYQCDGVIAVLRALD